TKSGKDYELPLNDFVKNYLTFWLKVRQDYGIKSPYLFPSAKGRAKRKFDTSRPVAALTVWRLFKSACIKAGLGSNYSPHSARATSITRLLAEGYDFRSVQAFSRHSSIAMVELYDKRRLTIEQNPALKLKF
ncbi:MAG: site-specific integrase, partial [Deltaproteobacteria bacterium]|nr:site-specific integrase [Deltaproteobacteria bacterium]